MRRHRLSLLLIMCWYLNNDYYLSFDAYSCSILVLASTKCPYFSRKSIPFCVWTAIWSYWSWKMFQTSIKISEYLTFRYVDQSSQVSLRRCSTFIEANCRGILNSYGPFIFLDQLWKFNQPSCPDPLKITFLPQPTQHKVGYALLPHADLWEKPVGWDRVGMIIGLIHQQIASATNRLDWTIG